MSYTIGEYYIRFATEYGNHTRISLIYKDGYINIYSTNHDGSRMQPHSAMIHSKCREIKTTDILGLVYKYEYFLHKDKFNDMLAHLVGLNK